ncbi:MAG: Rieske 2Fe-2S domain-containing protein [Burkholderiaceae bacterium]|nr:Rieske 2Fe-2S domain-containing protein [Microbacteriaceae bacterium]
MNQDTPRAKRHQKYVVGRVDEFPESGRMIVDIRGREVGIFRIRNRFYAVLNRCPHLGGPLVKGQLVNAVTSTGPGNMELDTSKDLIACPWHNWEFDIKTGQSFWNPKHLKARPFAVGVEVGNEVAEQIETGAVGMVEGPYRAETVQVAVESEYIVLFMVPQAPGTVQNTAGTHRACESFTHAPEEKEEVTS